MAEKKERRSIADAMNMTPEALAFIGGGQEKTIEVKSKSKSKTTNQNESNSQTDSKPESENNASKTQNRQPQSERRRTYRSNDNRSSSNRNTDLPFGMNNLLVPLTTRLQPFTAAALKRAGLEQKLNGRQPSTVQEIAEIAIQSWLNDNGYGN